MRYIKKYLEINETSSHWREDVMKLLSWNDDIQDLLYDFTDIGCKLDISREIFDSNFNYPGPKSEALHKDFYQGYSIRIVIPYTLKDNVKEICQNMIDLIDKLDNHKIKYMFRTWGSQNDISFRILDKKIDTNQIINDVSRAKIKSKVGIENAYEKLLKHSKVMNISKYGKNIIITQKSSKYDLGRLHTIIGHMFKNKSGRDDFKVTLDSERNRIIVHT